MFKNKILLVTGIGDTYFAESSDKKLTYGYDLAQRVQGYINSVGNGSLYTGIVNLINTQDTDKEVNVTSKITKKSKVVDYKMFNHNSLFDAWNSFSIVEDKKVNQEYNAKAFDWIFPASNYEVHICGVDINGFYKDLIVDLLDRGYTVYLYSDMIKRFKNTEALITSINNKNFVYCSHKSIRK